MLLPGAWGHPDLIRNAPAGASGTHIDRASTTELSFDPSHGARNGHLQFDLNAAAFCATAINLSFLATSSRFELPSGQGFYSGNNRPLQRPIKKLKSL